VGWRTSAGEMWVFVMLARVRGVLTVRVLRIVYACVRGCVGSYDGSERVAGCVGAHDGGGGGLPTPPTINVPMHATSNAPMHANTTHQCPDLTDASLKSVQCSRIPSSHPSASAHRTCRFQHAPHTRGQQAPHVPLTACTINHTCRWDATNEQMST
jgi:hypothetical protein